MTRLIINHCAIALMGVAAALLVAGCAERPMETETGPPPHAAATRWLQESGRTIGVVALGPTQRMNQQWYDFDADVQRALARGPTHTTPGHDVLTTETLDAGDALLNAFSFHSRAFQGCHGQGCAAALAFLPIVPLDAMWRMTVGEINIKWIPPRVDDLAAAIPAAAQLPASLMDKKIVVAAVRDRLEQLAAATTSHTLTTLRFEDARDPASPARAGLDGVLTLRVVDIGLEGERGDDGEAALAIHLWMHLNQATFIALDYKGRARPLSAWAADDARLLREEFDRAVQDIAGQIIDSLFLGGDAS